MKVSDVPGLEITEDSIVLDGEIK